MLTKLLTTSGNEVESAKTIGVKIKAAPSLAKNAAISAPNIMIYINIFNPCPLDALTI